MSEPRLQLGGWRSIDSQELGKGMAAMPAHHLVTHSVIVGMTGSGKTGLVCVTVEEALRNEVPVLIIDVKGDLPNLLLSFPRFDPLDLVPWVEPSPSSGSTSAEQLAAELNEQRRESLKGWSIGEAELRQYVEHRHIRVITPGSTAGELLHVLSSLERRSSRWDTDPEAARDALSAAVSLVLRLLGRDPEPAKSREHVLLSVLAESRLRNGESADLSVLLQDVTKPPIERIGALDVD
ncbi:MAG TPA: helicase HerA-like domain-containing protein, partial [Polyangiaceae bacterium]